jgi:hypothetical protein
MDRLRSVMSFMVSYMSSGVRGQGVKDDYRD